MGRDPQLADKLLYRAKQDGRNQLKHQAYLDNGQ
ncbi:protein of unknown function [Vibrio tapetis subsp. tapetis]|uniref:Uncharacterized protein n=1 Tax=Vibrio tapetis subsp. tapetis TaxID=1671868 RepID=A0A2N8ZMT6_9VIBR|nr:protein of unknown function [Vibrio tapetis subsp. tapetis]